MLHYWKHRIWVIGGYIGFLVGSALWKSTCNVEDTRFDPEELGRSWRSEQAPTPVFTTEKKFHSMDNIIPGVAKSQIQLERLSHFRFIKFPSFLAGFALSSLLFNLFSFGKLREQTLSTRTTHAGLPLPRWLFMERAGKFLASHEPYLVCAVPSIIIPLPEFSLLRSCSCTIQLSPGNKLEDSVWLKASCTTSGSWVAHL